MTMIRRATRSGRLMATVAAAALLAFGGRSVQAQVMDQVPSDSLAVLKINHLQDTSTKFAGLMQALGVTDFVPTLADPLAGAMTESGITGGIDKAGDAAVAVLDFNWDRPPNEPPFLIIVPVSDYKAFLAGTTVVSTAGDVSTVHFKNDTQNVFVTQRGSFAVMSPSQDALAHKATGTLKPAALAAKQLESNDATIYVNFPLLKTKLLPKLQSSRQQVLDQVDRALAKQGGATAKNSPLLKALVNRGLDVVQGFVQDADATTFGLTFGKAGINGTLMAEFAAGSYSGNLAGAFQGTTQQLFKGMPGQKYLFYAGGVNESATTTKALNDFVGPIEKELAAMGDTGTKVQTLIDSWRDSLGALQSGAGGMVAPNPQAAGGLVQVVGVYKGDAEKLKANQAKSAQTQQDVMKAMGLPNADMQKTTFTPGAQTVAGVSFDLTKVDFNFKGNTPQEMQAQQAINFMYGPNGFSVLSGNVDAKTMVVVGGGDEQLINAVVTAAKSNTDPLSSSDPVKAVDAELPKIRIAAVYIPLDTIASTAVGYAGKFGFPVPVQIPPNLPPIGMTLSTEGTAFRVDGHVPTPLVQSLVQAVMQVIVQMRGGGGGAGGGGAGGL